MEITSEIYVLIWALAGTIAVINFAEMVPRPMYSQSIGPYYYPGDYGEPGLYSKPAGPRTEKELEEEVKKEKREKVYQMFDNYKAAPIF